MIAPDELERYFQHRTEQDAFSGVVLITQSSTQLCAGTYGYASRSWKVPNTLTMRFDTASVTKLFTAVATLQLIDRGLLSFDTSVIDFLFTQLSAWHRERDFQSQPWSASAFSVLTEPSVSQQPHRARSPWDQTALLHHAWIRERRVSSLLLPCL
jgi:hypothetical protein